MSIVEHRQTDEEAGRRNDCRASSEGGFSLVELMVVIAVFGVVLAFSFVSLQQGMPGHQLRGTSTKLASELRLARQKAITQNNCYVVTFDPSSDSYSIWDDDESDGYRSAGEEVRVVQLPEGIQFGTINIGASNSVTFRANGSTDKGGYVDVYGGGASQRRVEVIRATGTVTDKRLGS